MNLLRESCAFAGAARATLLQLAHPYVAAGVAAHSSIGSDGDGVQDRFYKTFFYLFRIIFGEKRIATIAALMVRKALLLGWNCLLLLPLTCCIGPHAVVHVAQ